MRRVHTTYDLLDGHVLTALLREHGIGAWLFDADFVRQNWLQSIAYGGYRIMVRDEDVDAARALLTEQHADAIAPADNAAEPCPRCAHHAGRDDPQPRRNIFLVLIVYCVFGTLVFLSQQHASPERVILEVALLLLANLSLPWLFIRYFKWRLRCAHCDHRWRQAPRPYRELNRMLEIEAG